MSAFVLTLLVVLVLVDVVLVLMILGLARELGRVQVRLGPLGARVLDSGPAVGDTGPSFSGLVDHMERDTTVAGERDKPQLLMFTGPKCSTCKALLPGIKAMAKAERDLDVVLISDGTEEEHREFLAGAGIGAELSYLDARDVGIAYQVGTTPYGILLDTDGSIAAKGLCNNMQHVESLLNALESGTPTIQHLYAGIGVPTAS
ncbi:MULTISPECIES: redoxin domain-containing protein [unclassified Dietzia]|uniref:redoxin domain-containing protein n=1 Tax=unclassified Dietzia TaxID=2617939 RepID=UPI000D21222F|nr:MULTISPECIES: redoxin domain-containing protein [unclassified Dietzia]AVZ39528.1 methylamine utilization protein [Dietzia sp. JS16-p6b]MBB1023845.1 redoxin domain-containing protein [Dietzia sp. DQ12-76]MBB1027225.1 redoxin domain-containing protein [Dietzia sp. DQ11-38-2]QGW24821.1 methylamine utilization protein [Dietzia sp. DQ12-45-1b]